MGFAACKQKTFQTNNKYSYDSSNCCIRHYKPMTNKVLKLGSDRTFRLKKPRTVHFCSSFSFKNHSMRKNRDPYEPRSDLTVLRIVIRPVLMVPYFPLNLNQKKKKHKKGEKEEGDDEEGVAP